MSPKKNPSVPTLQGEVVDKTESLQSPDEKKNVLAPAISGDNKNRPNFFIGTLNIAAAPVKTIARPLYHKKYRGRYKHAKKIFVFDMILVGLLIALAALAAFWFFYSPQKNYLTVSLLDKDTTIGQIRDFKITVKNNTDYILSDTKITLDFPATISFKEYPTNYNQQTNSLSLGSLKEKTSTDILFKGQVWGDINETQKIIMETSFTDPDKQVKEQIDVLEIPLTQSIFTVNWNLPAAVKVGQKFDFTINYKNTSSEPLAEAIIVPTLPADFTILSSTLDLNGDRWILKNIPAKYQGKIILSGYVNSLPANSNIQTLTLENFLNYKEKNYAQGSLIKNLEIQDNGLALQFTVADKKTFFKPGDEVTLNLHYQNNTAQEIKDLSFSLDLPAFLMADKKTPITTNKVTLGAKAEGSANLNFTIAKDLEPGEDLSKNFSLTLRPSASFFFADQPTILYRSFSQAEQFKISTFLKLHAESRYFTEEGDQLGRGPLPPKVGQTTKYWINFFLTSSPNSVKEVTFKAHLPEGITWTGKTTVTAGESLKYDSLTRMVTWKNDLVEATLGDTCPCVGGGFEVALTPIAENVGQTLNLLDQLSLTGTDIYTNEFIQTSAANLTTNLITDTYAKGKHKIQ